MNAFLQHAAFNLGATGPDLKSQFRRVANCSTDESCYYSEEVGSLKGVKEPLSLAEHAIEDLLRSIDQGSSLNGKLQAGLKRCRQLKTELLEFLLPGQSTTESLVDSGNDTGIQIKWSQLTNQVDLIDEYAAEMTHDAWSKAKARVLELVDGCLLGFPEALTDIESQLPGELKPFMKLARRISELREQLSRERQNANDKILGMYFRVLKIIEPELRPLFDECIRLQPALRSGRPLINDEDIESSLLDIRTSITKTLAAQSSLETSLAGLQRPASQASVPTVQAAIHAPSTTSPAGPIPGSMQTEDAPQGSDVDPQAEFNSKESTYGVEVCGKWVKLASERQEGILRYLCTATTWTDALTLSKVLGEANSSEPSGVKKLLTVIRKAIRLTFGLAKNENPIPTRNRNRQGSWKLDEKLLSKGASELQDQKSASPLNDRNQ